MEISLQDIRRWHLPSWNTHVASRREVQVCPSDSFYISLNAILLYGMDHNHGLRMYATFFISLWKCEKCANRFLVVAKRERRNETDRAVDGVAERKQRGSRIKLHLRDSHSLHGISTYMPILRIKWRKQSTTLADLYANSIKTSYFVHNLTWLL